MSFFDLFSRTVSGAEAEKLGYQLAGTDKRIGGELGKILGGLQRDLSFKSDTPPARHAELIGNVILETTVAPNGRVHYAVAVPRPKGRWATIRAGWRWDHNYPGYIADVVIKLNAPYTFIQGHEYGWTGE